MKSLLASVRTQGGLDRVDHAVQWLEDEWRKHGEGALDRLWTDQKGLFESNEGESIVLLAELIKTDLRCRFVRGQTPTVLTMEIVQDLVADSLWDLAVNQAGTPVTGLYKPYGNATATATQPHYSFNATPSGPTGDTILGGKAAEDGTEALTVEVAWEIDTWTKVTGA